MLVHSTGSHFPFEDKYKFVAVKEKNQEADSRGI
jgi:hypothetical protein